MKKYVLPLLTFMLLTAGATLLAYPHAAAWLSSYNQAKVVDAYNEELKHAQPPVNAQIQEAHKYNDALSAGVQVVPGQGVPTSAGSVHATNGEVLNYKDLLDADGNGLMARIKIPSINVDLPIYHGTSAATLLKGAGHLEGSSLPVGGVGTRTVITAHRGLASATMFTNLNRVKKGDVFTIETFGEVYAYRVFDIQVIDPNTQTRTLLAEPGRDLATLITCTPLGVNSHRIVVTGERVPTDLTNPKNATGIKSDQPGFPWWLVAWIAAIAAIAAFCWWLTRGGRKASAKGAGAAAAGATGDGAAAASGAEGAAASADTVEKAPEGPENATD